MFAAPHIFTAARIASALGRDKRSLLRVLRQVPATGKVFVQGRQFADAWAVESLPANYRADLDRLAKVKGYRHAVHLLTDGAKRWQPPIPLPELAEHHLTKAGRVKNALARAIALYVNPQAGMEGIYRIAHEDYTREFGDVSERTVRRIFDRVIDRDAGEENFDDVALYLDGRLSRAKGSETILPGLLNPHEQAVFRYLNAVKRAAAPTVEELDLIWFAVCESLHEQSASGMKAKASRRAMIAFLQRSAVTLSKNSDALKKLLKLKYARYVECGGTFDSFVDQRAEKSGYKRALKLSKEDCDLIVAHAGLNKGGRLAPALRDLREDGKLSYDLEAHHISSPASKSYVPKSIRDQVQQGLRCLKNMVHGPRTHQLGGAYITRDYSSMEAGDWYQADDVTLPVYYYEETEKGAERLRGQFLVMIDVRTDFVLGFLLISARNYNSLAIRSLITVCASKHGLPRRGFYFERGIWKSSKVISGDRNALPFDHADRGWSYIMPGCRAARSLSGPSASYRIGWKGCPAMRAGMSGTMYGSAFSVNS
jgi:intergrase/recombinase